MQFDYFFTQQNNQRFLHLSSESVAKWCNKNDLSNRSSCLMSRLWNSSQISFSYALPVFILLHLVSEWTENQISLDSPIVYWYSHFHQSFDSFVCKPELDPCVILAKWTRPRIVTLVSVCYKHQPLNRGHEKAMQVFTFLLLQVVARLPS